jgi:hypothetical protein
MGQTSVKNASWEPNSNGTKNQRQTHELILPHQ